MDFWYLPLVRSRFCNLCAEYQTLYILCFFCKHSFHTDISQTSSFGKRHSLPENLDNFSLPQEINIVSVNWVIITCFPKAYISELVLGYEPKANFELGGSLFINVKYWNAGCLAFFSLKIYYKHPLWWNMEHKYINQL